MKNVLANIGIGIGCFTMVFGAWFAFHGCMTALQNNSRARVDLELAPYYAAQYERALAWSRSASVGICDDHAAIFDRDLTDRVSEDRSDLANYGNDPIVGSGSDGYAMRASDL